MARYPIIGIVGALFIAQITSAFATTVVFAAMRALIEQFGDPLTVGWLVTIFLLVAAGVAAVAGRLGDLFGRRRLLLVMLFIASIGCIISAMTENLGLVLFGRALQGFSAAVLPLAFGIIREHLPQKQVPIAVGLMVTSASVGTTASLILGGLIVDLFDWRMVFVAAAVLGFVSLISTYFLIPLSNLHSSSGKLDIWGGVLFVPAIASGLFALSQGAKTWGWGDLKVWIFLVLSAGLLTIWVRHSLKHPNPLLNVRLFGNRNILIANLIAIAMALGSLQIVYILALLFQAPAWTGVGLGLTATFAGLAKLPSSGFSMIAGPITGWITSRFGNRPALFVGGGVMTLGWFLLIFFHDNVYLVASILCLASWGTASMFTTMPNIIIAAAPRDRTSEATGMFGVVRATFAAIGAQLIAILLATSTVTRPGEAEYASEAAMTLALATITFFSFVSLCMAFLLPNTAGETKASTIKVATDTSPT